MKSERLIVSEEELKRISLTKETFTVGEDELKISETEDVLIVPEDKLAPLTEEEKEIDHSRLVRCYKNLRVRLASRRVLRSSTLTGFITTM